MNTLIRWHISAFHIISGNKRAADFRGKATAEVILKNPNLMVPMSMKSVDLSKEEEHT